MDDFKQGLLILLFGAFVCFLFQWPESFWDKILNEEKKGSRPEYVGIPKSDKCYYCYGSGGKYSTCETCNGSGYVSDTRSVKVEGVCSSCDGYGKFFCNFCDGTGKGDPNILFDKCRHCTNGYITCNICKGSGTASNTIQSESEKTCRACDGLGKIKGKCMGCGK